MGLRCDQRRVNGGLTGTCDGYSGGRELHVARRSAGRSGPDANRAGSIAFADGKRRSRFSVINFLFPTTPAGPIKNCCEKRSNSPRSGHFGERGPVFGDGNVASMTTKK